MKKQPLILASLLTLATACSPADQAAVTTTAAPTTTAGPTTTIAFVRDEAAFLEGLKKREPERMKQLTDAQWIRWGDQGCKEMSDEVKGASDDLEKAMVNGGVDSDLAYRTASDLNNAAAGKLCDPPGAL